MRYVDGFLAELKPVASYVCNHHQFHYPVNVPCVTVFHQDKQSVYLTENGRFFRAEQRIGCNHQEVIVTNGMDVEEFLSRGDEAALIHTPLIKLVEGLKTIALRGKEERDKQREAVSEVVDHLNLLLKEVTQRG